MSIYADIILPVPLNELFTYSVPGNLERLAVPGARVYVPFGKGRRLTGLIVRTHGIKPTQHETKEILSVLDDTRPSVLPGQIKLMEWMSRYYICPPGDVLKAALPSGLRPDSSANEKPFKPRITVFVRQGSNINPEFGKTAVKQKELYERFLELSGIKEEGSQTRPVTKRALLDGTSVSSSFRALEDNGILETYEVETGRLPEFKGTLYEPAPLSPAQQDALDKIHQAFKSKNVCLLHGVTSSGKTEIYIHLIKEQIKAGRQVLYLLPEIALTTQIEHRLQRIFGNDMCVYHSRCRDNIRVEVWNRLTGDNPYKLILGARSAVLLPLKNPGLVIVDEEHEPSFKQEDPSPRYHGRNTAIMLASIYGAKTLLGSATPALESYSNAISGKYGLVALKERYSGIRMPEIIIVDTAELKRKKYMQGLFSPQLIESMRQALDSKRQVILFHNRRGYAATVECPDCGWVQKCDCCDVSLTFHKSLNTATCHYCGHSYHVPAVCPKCSGNRLRNRGFGTEKIEEEVSTLFPESRTARLDLDSAKNGYETILEDFREGHTDILIGTQMVSKGLDFDKVSVVGILQADSMLSYPDFRSTERGYQLMAQVAGRAGRKEIPGKVIIQTRQPEAPVMSLVRRNDYESFYQSQMEERSAFGYPPYTRIVAVNIKGSQPETVDKAALILRNELVSLLGEQKVLGPDAPPVSRVMYRYIRRIIIKLPLELTVDKSRALLSKALDNTLTRKEVSGITVSFDPDPQ
jgi:primosomal protein N' (replication factor Y)